MRDRLIEEKQMTRKIRGNMLVLSGVFVTVNAVALLVASSFGSLYFVHNRLQTTADELALEGARKLNEQDRIGQMNNMVARCRQLVYDSNESNDEASSNLNQLQDLADDLHKEARDGALLLNQERQKLLNVSTNEARSAMLARFNSIKEGHALLLPWLQVDVPSTPQIKFGKTEKVQSNVGILSGLSDLESMDKVKYQATDGSKLYKEGINARLDGSPDVDLNFKISSLPAPVQNSISPARAILARSFKTMSGSDDQLYSSVQIEMQIEVNTTLGASAHSTMKAIGTACATGGQPVL